jgi:hypothetical protein
MRGIAEARGWHTICGVEVVLEGCVSLDTLQYLLVKLTQYCVV